MNRHVVDLQLELVQDPIVLLDPQRQVVIPLDQRPKGLVDRRLGVARHRQQLLLQRFQSGVEKRFHNSGRLSQNGR